jgi:hypothetical protein
VLADATGMGAAVNVPGVDSDLAVCEHKDGPRLCCKHGRGPNSQRRKGREPMTDNTDNDVTRLASDNSCRREGETYAMGVGRADVLDFIRYPPGSPPHVRGSMAELANAIAAGRHSGALAASRGEL